MAPCTENAVVLEPRRDLSSTEDLRFPALSKYTKTTAFAARAGLLLEQARSEQPLVEANQGCACLGCWGGQARRGRGTHHRVGLVLWLLTPRSPVGSQVHPCQEPPPPPWAALGALHHLLPDVVLGLQGWSPLPIAFPIPGVAVLSLKTPGMFLWAVHLGL